MTVNRNFVRFAPSQFSIAVILKVHSFIPLRNIFDDFCFLSTWEDSDRTGNFPLIISQMEFQLKENMKFSCKLEIGNMSDIPIVRVEFVPMASVRAPGNRRNPIRSCPKIPRTSRYYGIAVLKRGPYLVHQYA